jgi:20S proteasome alpha/beta subunit|tara:strand:- start:131 stop:331 length:201 start_codon:yes stop_codon:yes gene_type:complete
MGKIIHRGIVKRKPGHLYYIDASGHVCEAKMARGGKKKKAAKKKVAKKKPVKKKVAKKKPVKKKKK